MDYPAFDNHVHLQMNGENLQAAKRFERAGGKILNICNIPEMDSPVKIEYFMNQYETIIKISEMVRRETSLKVLVTIGPYPVDLIKATGIIGKEEAMDLFMDAIDLAINYIENGRANALGEIGRPHFPVDNEIWQMSNEILLYAMKRAKETGIPVILHTESADEKVFSDLAGIADRAGIDKNFVIKHFSPPLILEEENHGIFPSVISSRENVRASIKKGFRFFLETDFLDDPGKKGAVMDITTVPKRFKMLEQESRELLENYSYELKKNILRLYGLELKEF